MKSINRVSDGTRRLLPLPLYAWIAILSLAGGAAAEPPIGLPLTLTLTTETLSVASSGYASTPTTITLSSNTGVAPSMTIGSASVSGAGLITTASVSASLYTCTLSGTTCPGKTPDGSITLSCATPTTCTASQRFGTGTNFPPGNYMISVTTPVLWPSPTSTRTYYNPAGTAAIACGRNLCAKLTANAYFTIAGVH
jgi:hypothetical protein